MTADHTLAAKYAWWWRDNESFALKLNFQTERRKTNDTLLKARWFWWKDGTELAAYRYELVRRLRPEMRLRPWVELGIIQNILRKQIGDSTQYYLMQMPNEDSDDPAYSCPMQFNLLASDTALEEAFILFIREQRKAKRISKPKLPPKNSVSWRWPELWDMNDLEEIPLNNSQHGQKAKAKALAKDWESRVLAALAKIKLQKS
jgi:hypothetical protein